MRLLRRVLDHRASPLAAAAVAVLLAGVLLQLDRVVTVAPRLPAANARTLLGAAFGAMVTIGAFTFWMRPIAAQMAAASVPPRIIAGRLHDRIQRIVVAAAVGALTFIAVVLCAQPPGGGAAPTIATLTAVGVAIGGVTGLLIAMQRAERSTRPGQVLAGAVELVIADLRAMGDGSGDPVVDPYQLPEAAGERWLAVRSGWVQRIDAAGLATRTPPGSVLRVDATLGAFVIADWTPLVTVWTPDDDAVAQPVDLASLFEIGAERGGSLDVRGALVQVVDICVHAAVGGSASPSVVYEALWHLGAVLHEVIRCELPPRVQRFDGDRVVVLGGALDRVGLLDDAVDRLRQAVADLPVQAEALVEVLLDVQRRAREEGRTAEASVLERQLDRCVEQCRRNDPLPADLDRVLDVRAGRSSGSSGSDDYVGVGPRDTSG